MDSAGLVIIGAGAAGLAAAIFSAEQDGGRRIALLDGVRTLGTKILVSGGGRCNVTHEAVTAADFFGNRRIIKNVVAAFSVEQTVDWFASMGVRLKHESVSPAAVLDLPGQIRSSVNDRLDRHEGGQQHAQETVHTRRDPSTSADG